MDERNFSHLLFTPETFFIKLEVAEKEYNCILKDVQYHPVSDHVLHADFLEYEVDQPLITQIPIKVLGSAPGVIAGGVMVRKFRKLPIRALPADMPEFIEIDISKLEINDMVHVSDVKLVNAEVMEKGERFVIGVKTTRLAEVVEEVEEEEVEEGEEGAEGVPAEGAEGAPAEGKAEGGEGAKAAPAADSDKK